MNCYNGGKYLTDALESVLNQTFRDWELIFWDNQSTDQSSDIFNRYNDPRFKYYYSDKHTKLYKARNYAVKKANSEFLTFLDVDDIWEFDKLEKQLLLFGDKKVGLVYGKYKVFNELIGDSQPILDKKLPTGWVVDELLKDYVVGLLTIMVRRKAFDSLEKQFDDRFHIIGDFDLVLRMSTHWKFDCIQETVAYYRQHGDNESGKHRNRFIEESLTWYGEMRFHPDFSEKQEVYNGYNLYLYNDALLNKLEGGTIMRTLSVFSVLPFGVLMVKLIIITLTPRVLYRYFVKFSRG